MKLSPADLAALRDEELRAVHEAAEAAAGVYREQMRAMDGRYSRRAMHVLQRLRDATIREADSIAGEMRRRTPGRSW